MVAETGRERSCGRPVRGRSGINVVARRHRQDWHDERRGCPRPAPEPRLRTPPQTALYRREPDRSVDDQIAV